MSKVTHMWMFVQTSTVTGAGTSASLNLTVNLKSGNALVLATKSQQKDTNGITTAGTTAQFSWKDGGAGWPLGALTSSNLASFTLGITGETAADAWVPSAIWVVYRSDTDAYSLGPHHPNWPTTQCFSSQPSDCSGNAKQIWPLSWSQLDPIVAFAAGGITEVQLEPSESATYQFVVSNVSSATTIDSMVLGLQYDQPQFTADGISFGVAVGSSGLPEINVTASVPPGGSIPVSFAIYTSNAKVRNYTFGVKLLAVSAAAGANSSLYVDKPHAFTVVAS
jgi:hypothetical protein